MWIPEIFDFKFTEIENEFHRKINYDMIFNEKIIFNYKKLDENRAFCLI